jgi:acyl-CoA reductase-like NAD-dependent aldehyde dehydrogenase
MDTSTSFPQPVPVRPVPPAVAAGERVVARPAEPAARNVGVEWAERSDGVQVMTFIDRRTGVVISQTPAQQVLAVVDAIVAAIQQREG